MRRSSDFGAKFLVVFFLLIGLSLCGYWATQLSGGFLTLGVNTVMNDSYVIWHIVVEIITGVLAVISAFLILSRNLFGLRLGLFTCGLLLYTGLNSIGWGMRHDPGLLVLFIISAVVAIFGFFYILGQDEL